MSFYGGMGPASRIPKGEDHIMRSIKDLERAFRELLASTAVRPGSLNSDALTNPAHPTIASATAVFSQSTTLGTGLTLTRPSWASRAYIAGAAVCNSNTFINPGKTIYWQVDTSPISDAALYPQSKTIAYVSTVDSVPLFDIYTVWPTVLTVGSAPTLYVAPVSSNAMAGGGSISITFSAFVLWFK